MTAQKLLFKLIEYNNQEQETHLATTLRAALTRIASQHPETRVHLVPLLRKHAACSCSDEVVAEADDDGDAVVGGRNKRG